MGVEVRVTDDTLLAHVSQDERKGSHKLKVLGPTVAKVDTGIDWVWHHTHKHAGKRESERDEEKLEWKDIPKEDLVPYCGQDAIVTLRLHSALRESDDDRSRGVYRLLQRAFRAFSDGTVYGVMVDQDALQRAAGEVGKEVEKLREGFDFNPESHPQTLKALQEAGYRVCSTGIDVIRELEGKLPEQLIAYREVEKLYNGFLQPLPGLLSEDGRVRATYKIHGTDSGRTSCADPNLQQVPPSLRHLFIAKPGHVFVGWDFKVHEVRGLAYYSQDRTLAEFLRDESADPHRLVGDRVGLDRQVGKGAVFAVAYGAGPGKLVRQFGITPTEAERAYNAVRELFPALDAWKESVYKAIEEQGYVETPYGRQRWFHLITNRGRAKAERIAVNFLVQSFAGDIALESAIKVYEELGYPPLIFVHDFNAIEVPEKVAKRVREKAERIVRAVFKNDLVAFVPEFYIGRHWGELKHAT